MLSVEDSIVEALDAFTCWLSGRGIEYAARGGKHVFGLRYCEGTGVKDSSLSTAPQATWVGDGQQGLSTSDRDGDSVSCEGTLLLGASAICASSAPCKSGKSSLLGDIEESGSGCWKSYLNIACFVVLDQASLVVQMRKVRSDQARC